MNDPEALMDAAESGTVDSATKPSPTTSSGENAHAGTPWKLDFDASFAAFTATPTRAKPQVVRWTNLALEYMGEQTFAGVSGEVRPGDVVAVMGPPKSHKTKLLSVLAGRIVHNGKTVRLAGDFFVGESSTMPYEYRRNVGYVLRVEALHGFSTVRENIAFSAHMRLPRGTPHTDALIDDLVSSLGLTKHANDILIKLPPLQRKLAALAAELALLPTLVLIDEPVTGLDAVAGAKFMRVLHALAANTRIGIVAALARPSSDVFSEVSQLMLLSGGHVVFQGHASEMLSVFATKNLVCPPLTNPADFCLTCIQVLPLDQLPNDDGNTRNPSRVVVSTVASGVENGRRPATLTKTGSFSQSDTKEHRLAARVSRTGFVAQYVGLLQREFRAALFRNKVMVVGRTILTSIISVIIGCVFLYQGSYTSSTYFLGSHLGAVVMILFVGSFGAMSPAVIMNFAERDLFVRERASHMYGSSAYFLAKLTVELLVNLWIAVLTFLIMYWMIEFQGSFGWLVLALYLALEVNFSFGVLIASVVPSLAAGLGLVPLALVPQLFFFGTFVRISSLPVFLQWCEWVVFLKYSINIIISKEWPTANNCAGTGVPPGTCAGWKLLKEQNSIDDSLVYAYCLILVLFFVALRVLAFVKMTSRARKAKRVGRHF